MKENPCTDRHKELICQGFHWTSLHRIYSKLIHSWRTRELRSTTITMIFHISVIPNKLLCVVLLDRVTIQ